MLHGFPHVRGFPNVSAVKESACNAGETGDSGSIPGLGRSPGGGNGNLSRYSCLENSMDSGAWQVTVLCVTVNITEHACTDITY